MPTPPTVNHRRAFRDIKNGFSEINVLGSVFYLKHISFEDQVDFDEVRDKHFNIAREQGVPTEEELLARLLEEGQWSSKQERAIKAELDFIANLSKQKKSLYLKSEIDRVNKDIDSAQERLNKLKNDKMALLSSTAESSADERVNDFYILKCLYKDKELKNPAYSQDEFDSIDTRTLYCIIEKYNEVYKQINDLTIQKIVLQDFFDIYAPFAENSHEFFGVPVCELSCNQLKLLIYSRYFKNAFSQNPNMPESIRDNPEAIFDYISANANVKKIREGQEGKSGEGGASSMPGATKADLEYLGIVKKGEKTLSLSEEAKKKGGTLSMQDMMSLMG
jgi:hypothetical protein